MSQLESKWDVGKQKWAVENVEYDSGRRSHVYETHQYGAAEVIRDKANIAFRGRLYRSEIVEVE